MGVLAEQRYFVFIRETYYAAATLALETPNRLEPHTSFGYFMATLLA
jgi:hypothetical protein